MTELPFYNYAMSCSPIHEYNNEYFIETISGKKILITEDILYDMAACGNPWAKIILENLEKI